MGSLLVRRHHEQMAEPAGSRFKWEAILYFSLINFKLLNRQFNTVRVEEFTTSVVDSSQNQRYSSANTVSPAPNTTRSRPQHIKHQAQSAGQSACERRLADVA
jgi:hypothetical protein